MRRKSNVAQCMIGGAHDLLVNPARLRLPALDQFADGLDRQIRSMLSAHEGAAALRDAEREPVVVKLRSKTSKSRACTRSRMYVSKTFPTEVPSDNLG